MPPDRHNVLYYLTRYSNFSYLETTVVIRSKGQDPRDAATSLQPDRKWSIRANYF